jgi:hypothetical protein
MHSMGVAAHACLLFAVNGRQGMFKAGFDKYSIIPLFNPNHPDIIDNKNDRWVDYMGNVAGIFDRSDYIPKYGRTIITWRKPMFNRLQSSNEDVEHEMDVIRAHPAHSGGALVMIGGDGLFEIRAEHAIARNPQKWIFTLPMVLPVRGEQPHGGCHLLHGGWRLWHPWMENLLHACDLDYHTKADFLVSDYKQYDFAICILMRAVAEFIDEVSRGGTIPMVFADQFLEIVSQNLDAAYAVHFLYDFAFMYWQYRQNVRKKGVRELDLIWRESTAIFNTKEGHKTHYAPMNVTHIYRQEALIPPVRKLLDEMRTLSLTGTYLSCACVLCYALC